MKALDMQRLCSKCSKSLDTKKDMGMAAIPAGNPARLGRAMLVARVVSFQSRVRQVKRVHVCGLVTRLTR